MLQATRNIYHGMIIDKNALPQEDDLLLSELQESLARWEKEDAALTWLTLPAERNALVPAVMNLGFVYHNCNAAELTLVKRIKAGAFVPSFATHYIGAGGVVINEKNQLLVISEKAHSVKHFKLPGGLLDGGEDIAQGVVREVFEETGIKTKFESLICLRHSHSYQFGKSDIYFVCRLTAHSSEITADPREIHEARWMAVEEYLNREDTRPFNRLIVEAALGENQLVPTDISHLSSRYKNLEVFIPQGGENE
ncbi:MAG: NUDIX domain-containing protein [Spirochaetales bacterium]|nr:NUDIX domain-containing protein [Spirochaetales bacterium]